MKKPIANLEAGPKSAAVRRIKSSIPNYLSYFALRSSSFFLRPSSFALLTSSFVLLTSVFSAPAFASEIVGWGGQKLPNAPLTNLTKIAAGGDQSLALRTNGSIVGWGGNGFGEATPPAGNDFTAVSAGEWYSLALKSDGSIVGWGRNTDDSGNWSGQATPPAGNDFIAVAAGWYHSLALKSDGSIVGWGYNNYGQATPPAGNDFVAVAAGGYHSLALKSDGSIVGWGWNYYGQATPPDGNDFIAVAAGYLHSLALKSDGSIVVWGRNYYGQATPPAGNDFVAISAGEQHSLALRSDGSIVGWGYNPYGQATPPGGNDFLAVAAGYKHSLALKSDGTIVGWGGNSDGQATPPAGNNFIAVAAGWECSLALKSDGSVVGWEDNWYGQSMPPDGNDFIAVTAGGYHSLALKSDGTIVGWGNNSSYGEATPPSGNDFIAVAAGLYYSLALKSDGSIIGWGDNSYGQAMPPAGNDFIAVAAAAGGYHSLALKSNGTIVGWGWNGNGEAMPPAGNNFIAITAGVHHSLALKSDGSVVGWGWNGYGGATPPAGNDFIAVAAGNNHSLALKSDGSIVGWGANYNGQATPPAGNDFIAVVAGNNHSLALKGGQSFLTFRIMRTEPLHAGNTGPAMLRVIGSGIKDGAIVRLTRGVAELAPMETSFISSWRLDAKFDLNGATPGKYNIVVTNPGGQSVQLVEGFEVVNGGSPHLWTRLTVPPVVRPGRSYTAYIEYGNDGDTPLSVPILDLRNSRGVQMEVRDEETASQTQLLLLGLPTSNDRTELLPGEKGTIPIIFTAPADGEVEFSLSTYQPDSTPFDWDATGETLRPQFADPVEWNTEWRALTADMGTTWKQVVDELMIWRRYMSFPAKFGFGFLPSLAYTAWMRTTLPCEQTGVFNPEQDVQVVPVRQVANPTHTFIVTHGWNANPNDPEDKVYQLIEKMATSCSNANVIKVDWQKGACTGLNAWEASGNIQAAGEAAYPKLVSLLGQDFHPEQFVYIGHSFGNGVNKVIASQAGRDGRAVILSPANAWGGWSPDYEKFYRGGSVAIISRSLGDNGPCWPTPRWIADRQILVDSGLGGAGHGKTLDCFMNQVPSNPEESCSWIESFFSQTQNLQKGPAGGYDAKMNDNCSGLETNQPFPACSTTRVLNIIINPVAFALSMVIRPIDPSEKRGNEGYDPCGTSPELCKHFVEPNAPLEYTIFFENEPNATAPAQEVRILDCLNPALDWTTLELGEIVFGDQVVTTLAGKVSGQDTVPLADSNYVVDVNAQFNVHTGRISWVLRTIDPVTGQLPEDPQAGFLPPNDSNHAGEGHVSFRIYPQEDLPSAHIPNKATIFFDTEPPFDVNVWINTVDGLPPVSAVSPLPVLTTPIRFEVCWSGEDGGGSGVAGYDVYVATNNEPCVPWILNTTQTSAVFAGAPGYTYRFYSIARDFLGNVEPAPAVPDAETTLRPLDFHFYVIFANRWLESDCGPPLWCDGMDFDGSQMVDLEDVAILAGNWLLDCKLYPEDPACTPR
jgi:alpha-tubulin suppressor-like RCC1 family protein